MESKKENRLKYRCLTRLRSSGTEPITLPTSDKHLKKARYLHTVHDSTTGSWIYTNLANNRLLEVSDADHKILERILDHPDDEFTTNDPFLLGLKEVLIRSHFLVEATTNEISRLERLYELRKSGADVAGFSIVLTRECNLRCVYCNQEHSAIRLGTEDEKAIMALIDRTTRKAKKLSITWWGGEPLIASDQIDTLSAKMIAICESRGVDFHGAISTNGVLLSGSICEMLHRNKISKLQVTLDGPQRHHDGQRPHVSGRGSYHHIIRGLRNLTESHSAQKELVTIRVNISSFSPTDPREWEIFFDDISPFSDTIQLIFTPVIPTFRFDESKTVRGKLFESRVSQLEQHASKRGIALANVGLLNRVAAPYCTAVTDSNWFILPGGGLAKCTTAFDDPRDSCGRVNGDGSLTFTRRAEEWITFSPFKEERCRKCGFLPICMGGCPLMSFEGNSDNRCHIRNSVYRHILNDPRRESFRKLVAERESLP